MVSEENLEELRRRDARYIVGTPKAQLKRFSRELQEASCWYEVQPGLEVKLIEHPDGEGKEKCVLCRSPWSRWVGGSADGCAATRRP